MHPLLSVVLPICCGIDVHKKTLTACLLQTGASGEAVGELRTFHTTTGQLQELARWLQQRGCRHVALESTGVYGKPVFNVLEPAGLEVVLVNAQHVKNVPGRKTDAKDAEWLATLLRVGLLRASLVPPKEIRELRDLTRYRTQVIRQRAQECNRIQKLLEDGNIKLAGVATDILGASGRDMLHALGAGPAAGQTPAVGGGAAWGDERNPALAAARAVAQGRGIGRRHRPAGCEDRGAVSPFRPRAGGPGSDTGDQPADSPGHRGGDRPGHEPV